MKSYGDTKYCPACGTSRSSQTFKEEYISEHNYIYIKCFCGCGWLEKAKNNKEV